MPYTGDRKRTCPKCARVGGPLPTWGMKRLYVREVVPLRKNTKQEGSYYVWRRGYMPVGHICPKCGYVSLKVKAEQMLPLSKRGA
jgi:hypothetical protein